MQNPDTFSLAVFSFVYIYMRDEEKKTVELTREEKEEQRNFIYIYINSFGFQNDLESILFEISKIGKKMGRGVEGELLSTSASEEHR